MIREHTETTFTDKISIRGSIPTIYEAVLQWLKVFFKVKDAPQKKFW
jgi:hypothetical protein